MKSDSAPSQMGFMLLVLMTAFSIRRPEFVKKSKGNSFSSHSCSSAGNLQSGPQTEVELCDSHRNGAFNQIGYIVGVKFAHKPITMIFDGSLGSAKYLRYLFVGFA